MAANKKMTREDVEREMERAQRTDEQSMTIEPGQATPSFTDIHPNLDQAYLRGVDLSGLDLTDASPRYRDLRGAILEGTVLAGADLTHANLTDTMRTEGADLSGVTLYLAHLEGADLIRTRLEPALPDFLKNATYSDDTCWPVGFDPSVYGARRVGRIGG